MGERGRSLFPSPSLLSFPPLLSRRDGREEDEEAEEREIQRYVTKEQSICVEQEEEGEEQARER